MNAKLAVSAANFLPSQRNLAALRRAAGQCEGCPLYRDATQTVFGEGPRHAQLMVVGEMAGDQEDRQGKPFVGPAGRLLDAALEEAGLARKQVYVTNAVKHFKWEPRGPRRLHKKPTSREIAACQPWLEAEIGVVQPRGIVCLGATSAQVLLGRDFRITKSRGQFVTHDLAEWVLATYHPSAVLRAPDAQRREAMRQELVSDLRSAAQH